MSVLARLDAVVLKFLVECRLWVLAAAAAPFGGVCFTPRKRTPRQAVCVSALGQYPTWARVILRQSASVVSLSRL
jgi:hypothetical protein